MKSKKVLAFSLFVFCNIIPFTSEAAFQVKDLNVFRSATLATNTVDEHYRCGLEHIQKEEWLEARNQFYIVVSNFPNSSFAQDARYYLGISEYYLGELDLANLSFTEYLKCSNDPKYFVETLEYKLAIADCFKNGARKRLFGFSKLPKWSSGQSLALEIYDEIIIAAPSSNLAVSALYAKGCLLWQNREFREAIDSLQLIIRRFPKHEMTPECYVLINKIYLDQCFQEFQNPDLLALAQINLRRFKADFPKEPRITEAEEDVQKVKEAYARGLFDTALFYERTAKTSAAVIYYAKTIKDYPDTYTAKMCISRLMKLDPSAIPCQENTETEKETTLDDALDT